jgi:hypothetical protein
MSAGTLATSEAHHVELLVLAAARLCTRLRAPAGAVPPGVAARAADEREALCLQQLLLEASERRGAAGGAPAQAAAGPIAHSLSAPLAKVSEEEPRMAAEASVPAAAGTHPAHRHQHSRALSLDDRELTAASLEALVSSLAPPTVSA